MSGENILILIVVLPAVAGLLIPLFADYPNLREGVTLVGATLLFGAVLVLLAQVLAGERPSLMLWEILPGLSVALAIEPLGMLFALIASGLWIVNSLYSIGYMRANREPRQTTFYVAFAAAIAAAMGVALAGNLFTLFLFYELLTLVTYPLVTHRATDEAKASGRLYLLLLLGSSTLLFLPAIAWTAFVAGTLDFQVGGIL
ncbi:MAG: proton-conducting transporter transmembrane domain-containing protein, partial [Alphaproteobacteria bacterium]